MIDITVKQSNPIVRELYYPNSIDEFLQTWAEWQFNPSIFTFKNDEVKITIHKYMYDYLFLEHFKIDIGERTRRVGWTPELEPHYGESLKYDTPFGAFIFTLNK